jgi:hypothetical protein
MTLQLLQTIVSFLTLGAFLFAVYKYFRDPDVKNSNEVILIKQSCAQKHEYLDKALADLSRAYTLMQENDLKHIEAELRRLSEAQVRIVTMMDERLPSKKVL